MPWPGGFSKVPLGEAGRGPGLTVTWAEEKLWVIGGRANVGGTVCVEWDRGKDAPGSPNASSEEERNSGTIVATTFRSEWGPPAGLEGHTATAVGAGDTARIIVVGGLGMDGVLNAKLHILHLRERRWMVYDVWGEIPRPR